MDSVIQDLIAKGAIEVTGVDSETGEFLYTFTQKLAEINPIIHKAMVDDFHSSLMRLWEQGFLTMDVTAQNPLVKATKKIFDQDAIDNLAQHDRMTLEDILKKMSE